MRILITLCLLIIPVFAQNNCGHFVLGGEGLYLKPCTDNLHFVTVDDHEFANKTTEEWGYSAQLGYVAADCSDVRITWSRLTTCDTREVAETKSIVEFDWRNLDAELGFSLLSEQDGPFVLQLIGGVRYTRVEFQRRLNTLRSRSESWGVGPRGGFYAKACLGGGYGIFGQFDFAFLAGRIRATEGEITSDRTCQLFPTFSFRLGADCTTGVGSGTLGRASLGLQITRVYSAIERLSTPNHLISPLDLIGLFVGLSLIF